MRDPCAMTVLWGKRRATLWQPCGLASATELRGMCPNSKPRAALRLLGYYQVLRESWGLVLAEKLEFCIIEAIEFKFEERLVTKAVGLPQEGFDLVVDAFHPAVVDAVLPPVQDSTSMEGESFGQLLHLTNARVDRPLAPFFEEDLHLVQAGLLPQQAQSLLGKLTSSKGSLCLS